LASGATALLFGHACLARRDRRDHRDRAGASRDRTAEFVRSSGRLQDRRLRGEKGRDPVRRDRRVRRANDLRRGTGPRLRGWNACVARWREIGLRIVFYNLGGQDAREPQFGYFRDAIITGKQWRTSAGLRIGQPWKYIFRYYPRSRPSSSGTWWSLVRRRWPYGGGGTYTGLAAKVMNGWVVAFQVYYQAGEE
jgi:hypothetical protein